MSVVQNHFLITIISSALLLSGCVKEKVIHERQAPESIAESFSQSVDCEQASCITIQKKSIGKIFLLMTSGKTAGSTPQWYDLKPQVVSFEKSGGKLALLGENYNSIYEEIQTVNLIQTFEILSEDETSVTFDWGTGLKTLIPESSYDVDGPLGGQTDFTDSSAGSIAVLDAFVRGIKFDEQRIELEQISKIKADVVSKNAISQKEETMVLNIQIQPYNLSSDFQPKEADPTRRVGFFVTKKATKGYSAGQANLITKWDLSEQKGAITVRISSAVPVDYLEAVKEGALYWNKVFGREIIQVVTGVNPQEGPKDRSITVRWIPWLDSGAAYAMGQSDPLTGEVLRAQVFMPSVFTGVGSATLVTMNGGAPVMAGATRCDFGDKFKKANLLAQEASDSQRLRLGQDIVRSTIAHELGHALGMRHNFAGSFSSKVSSAQVLESAAKYTQDPQHEGLETSTSIMDYLSGVDDVLLSARIKVAALAYDKMAMDWAYSSDDSALDESKSLYCSDDELVMASNQGVKVYGCEQYDMGNNPLLRNAMGAGDEVSNFVKTLTASILGRLFPADQPGVVADVSQVITGTVQWARLQAPTLQSTRDFMFDAPKGAKYISLEAAKAGRWMNAKMGDDPALQAHRKAALAEAGGYSGVLKQVLYRKDGTLQFDWLERQIVEILSSGYLDTGKTLSGREYQLTSEQREWIMAFYELLMQQNATAFESLTASLLPKENQIVNTPSGPAAVTELFSPGRISRDDGKRLVAMWIDLSQYQKGALKAKHGPQLSELVDLPQRGLKTADLKKWLAMLKTSNIGLDVTDFKNRAFELELRRIGQTLLTVGYHTVVATEEDIVAAVSTLQGLSQLDQAGATWFLNEIARAKILLEI